MLSQRAIRGKQKLASIAPLVAASAAEVSNPCRRQRPLISSTLCDAVSVQEPAFQRSLPCASQSRRTSADRYPPLRPAPFRQRPATLAVCASLPAMPEYNRPHRARCGAYGHPAAGSERGRSATRTSAVARLLNGLPIPIEIRPHVGAALAVGGAGEARLNIREPNVIWPPVGADGERVAAAIVRARLVQTASLFIAHLACRDGAP